MILEKMRMIKEKMKIIGKIEIIMIGKQVEEFFIVRELRRKVRKEIKIQERIEKIGEF